MFGFFPSVQLALLHYTMFFAVPSQLASLASSCLQLCYAIRSLSPPRPFIFSTTPCSTHPLPHVLLDLTLTPLTTLVSLLVRPALTTPTLPLHPNHFRVSASSLSLSLVPRLDISQASPPYYPSQSSYPPHNQDPHCRCPCPPLDAFLIPLH